MSWRPLSGQRNATHLKTQILGTVDDLHFWMQCAFSGVLCDLGCALFSSEFLSVPSRRDLVVEYTSAAHSRASFVMILDAS